MAYNALRRDIEAEINRDRAVPTAVDANDLLKRALAALGGPVQNNRPPISNEGEIIAEAFEAGFIPGYMECDK